MGRPKGSKNKARDFDISPAPYVAAADTPGLTQIRQEIAEAVITAPKPDHATIVLTDEDLAPARDAKARHERAAAKYQKQEIQSELRRKEIGEIEELSVPQVVPFDLSAAFTKIAQQKARAAGYRFAHNLRKTPEGWVFEASNSLKVKNDAPSDQP